MRRWGPLLATMFVIFVIGLVLTLPGCGDDAAPVEPTRPETLEANVPGTIYVDEIFDDRLPGGDRICIFWEHKVEAGDAEFDGYHYFVGGVWCDSDS